MTCTETLTEPAGLVNLVGKGSWDLDLLHLEGNAGGKIPRQSLGWLKPLPATASDEEIRAAYKRDGVVHITGLLNRDKVLDTREQYFKYVQPCGVLKEGTSPREGIFVGGDPSKFTGPGTAHFQATMESNEYLRLSVEAARQPFMNDFANDDNLMSMVSRLKPEWTDPFVFKRQLLRSNIPKSEKSSTQVHYDQIFLRAAPPTSLTAWVPIGDVSPISGGLLYLENSAPLGLEIEADFAKAAEHMSQEERLSAFNANMMAGGMLTPDAPQFAATNGRRWLVADYKAGDVVFHHPCMIHCSANNQDQEGRIRLATDLRFADKDGEYDYRWAHQYYAPNDGL